MGLYANLDYSRFGTLLDVVAYDNYPLSWWGDGAPPNYLLADEARIYSTALQSAFMRGAKDQAPFYVMEEQAANTGQQYYYGSGTPALIRLGAWQQVANGADGVQFFRWRTTRVGTEQHWEGILNWDGNTETARYAGVARIGREFAAASPHVFGGRVRARVAILHSPETRWAFQEQPLTPPPRSFAVEPQVRLRQG
jgi:beta-galactosidase